MGYYVTVTDAQFRVPENDTVLQVLKDLNKRDDLKRGGTWGENGKIQTWFSWMPENYDQHVTSVAEVFKALGFDTETKDGYVHLLYYDNKTGQEDIFLHAVAPYVKTGDYIEWQGEDYARYRHDVRDGKLFITYPKEIEWREGKELVPNQP